jgi:hypothetical protein
MSDTPLAEAPVKLVRVDFPAGMPLRDRLALAGETLRQQGGRPTWRIAKLVEESPGHVLYAVRVLRTGYNG